MKTLLLKWILILACAGIFLYAGIPKLLNPAGFMRAIGTYQLFPHTLSAIAAYYMPALEICAALALFLPATRKAAWGLLSALMIFFIVLYAISLVRGLDISCGCFGSNDKSSPYPLLFLRNFTILGLLIGLGIQEKFLSFKKRH